MPEMSQPQPYHQTANCHKSSSSILSSASEEEDTAESGSDEQTQQPVNLQWTHPSCPQTSVAHTHIQGATEERRTMKRHT